MTFDEAFRGMLRDEIRAAVREEFQAREPAKPTPPLMASPTEMLSVAQVAERCKCHEVTVRAWIRSNKLPASKPGRNYLVRAVDLERFLADGPPLPKSVPSPNAEADRILRKMQGR